MLVSAVPAVSATLCLIFRAPTYMRVVFLGVAAPLLSAGFYWVFLLIRLPVLPSYFLPPFIACCAVLSLHLLVERARVAAGNRK